MFRLFLLKKIFQGVKERIDSAKEKREEQRLRNRRIYERYNVDHKRLTMLNDQDIFVMRDISVHGFSTYASKRGIERLEVGDVFASRMRYLGEVYDLNARVSWKGSDVVGFEQLDPSTQVKGFIERLLRPIEIASSLREVDSEFMQTHERGKKWYHGDADTDLYVWFGEDEALDAWQLILKDHYVEWNQLHGMSTGVMSGSNAAVPGFDLPPSRLFVADRIIDTRKKQTAVDVIMAMGIPERDAILKTITVQS
jgi:hypothetical protein